MNNPLDPFQWGWETSKHGLVPIPTTQQAAPEELLKTICCTCSKGCLGACSCRKNGMKCTTICKICKGQSFPNAHSNDCIINTDDSDTENDLICNQEMSVLDSDDTQELEEIQEMLLEPQPSKRLKK